VYIIVPGWMVADAAGAHAERGLSAEPEPAAAAGWALTTAVATAAAARIENAAQTRWANEGRVMRVRPPDLRRRPGCGRRG
jgi:hypothetical protein